MNLFADSEGHARTARADLGLCYLQMPDDTFSNDTVQYIIL